MSVSRDCRRSEEETTMEQIEQEKLLRELGKGRMIRTVDEARAFYADLVQVLNYHPDTPFADYVELGTDGKQVFTRAEARKLEQTVYHACMACADANVDPDQIA